MGWVWLVALVFAVLLLVVGVVWGPQGQPCTWGPSPRLSPATDQPPPTSARVEPAPTHASLMERVLQTVPRLPAVPSRYDIRPRRAAVQAFARETVTEQGPTLENLSGAAEEMAAQAWTREALHSWAQHGTTLPPSSAEPEPAPQSPPHPAPVTPLTETIELVLYINQNEHRFQRTKIEKALTAIFHKDDRVEVLRVLGEKRDDDTVLAQLLSHVSALSVACEAQRNVLILEDTFKFYVSRSELQDHFRLVQQTFGDRWNVLVLGPTAAEWSPVQNGKAGSLQLMRILQGGFTAGYVVHRTYLPVLLNVMMEHIYLRYPDTVDTDALDHQLHQLQRTDVWLGFQSPVGGMRNETLDELAALTGAEERTQWTVRKHGVYVKATEDQRTELHHLLRHLYVERYKGHRLAVAVHHPVGQKLAHRHKRSYSSTFYEGVQYFSCAADVERYLEEFDTVQWIDLTTWCHTDDALSRLLRVLDDTASSSSGSESDAGRAPEAATTTEGRSVTSSECMLPFLNAGQRHRILSSP